MANILLIERTIRLLPYAAGLFTGWFNVSCPASRTATIARANGPCEIVQHGLGYAVAEYIERLNAVNSRSKCNGFIH